MNFNKIKSITNQSELIRFLSQEGGSYSAFILERINRDPSSLKSVKTNAHHIIPLHWKGPDQTWNLILLTLEEHCQAHALLYDNYRKLEDLGASQMLSGNLKHGADTIRQIAQNTMRRNQTGFFSSATQRDLGSRPKKPRKPFPRNEYVAAALARGFALENTKTGDVVTVEAFECPNVTLVVDKLMSHPTMKKKRENWDLCENKGKSSGVNGLTRLLTGRVDKKTGRLLYSCMGWRVLGININIE